jgi:hypothetical protein
MSAQQIKGTTTRENMNNGSPELKAFSELRRWVYRSGKTGI